MRCEKTVLIEWYRKFAYTQYVEWMNDEDCDLIIAEDWLEKTTAPDEDIWDDVIDWIGGRDYKDNFGSWSRCVGMYGEYFEDIEDVPELSDNFSLDYCWTPLTEDDEDDDGIFVARIWNNKNDKEVKGSRFHHEDLNSAIANSITSMEV